MAQQTIISNSKTPLPIMVIGGMLIVPGIYSVLFTILGLMAGGFNLAITASGIISAIVGIGLIKMKRWALYGLYIVLLATILFTVQELRDGIVMSVELLLLPIVALLATIYCWYKRALFS